MQTEGKEREHPRRLTARFGLIAAVKIGLGSRFGGSAGRGG
jgi:hypothetical protein